MDAWRTAVLDLLLRKPTAMPPASNPQFQSRIGIKRLLERLVSISQRLTPASAWRFPPPGRHFSECTVDGEPKKTIISDILVGLGLAPRSTTSSQGAGCGHEGYDPGLRYRFTDCRPRLPPRAPKSPSFLLCRAQGASLGNRIRVGRRGSQFASACDREFLAMFEYRL
jgi:hypothetical protein